MQPPAPRPVREDVLASGRDEPRWSPPPWLAGRRARLAGAGLLALAAVAFVAARDGGEPAVPEAGAGAITLVVVDTAIAVSQGGVLVVPVALTSPDVPLRVRSAEITAAPVRQESFVTAPDDVPQDRAKRLAVIVDPDCTVIGPGVGGELVATLVVRVGLPSGEEQDLRLAVGEAPAVRELLARLCGPGRAPVLGDADAAVAQDRLEDEALEVGLEVRKLDLGDGG